MRFLRVGLAPLLVRDVTDSCTDLIRALAVPVCLCIIHEMRLVDDAHDEPAPHRAPARGVQEGPAQLGDGDRRTPSCPQCDEAIKLYKPESG